MTVSHAWWEFKLLEGIVWLLALHTHSVGRLDWVVLRTLLIEGNFSNNAATKTIKLLLNTVIDVLTRFLGDVLDFFFASESLGFLSGGKRGESLDFTSLANIDELAVHVV